MSAPSILVVVPDRDEAAAEALTTAYMRESAGAALRFLRPAGWRLSPAWGVPDTYEACWDLIASGGGGWDFLHLAAAGVEPHPGWWQDAAAAAAAGFVPAAVLWRTDGTVVNDTDAQVDWAPCGRARLPFLTPAQLAAAGPPPLEGREERWPKLDTVVRLRYAFTLLGEEPAKAWDPDAATDRRGR